ncbi:hypothetical protein BH23CHL5_BH23CHL5_00900 [soil metagenome]
MSLDRWILIVIVLAVSGLYYLLTALAIQDLMRRPAVRGDNKLVWMFVIVCIPILGALTYGYMGAASFLPRSPRMSRDSARPVHNSPNPGPERRSAAGDGDRDAHG